MAIRYGFRPVNDNLNEDGKKKKGVRPVALSYKNINGTALAQRIKEIGGTSTGAAEKAISDVFDAIERELAAGNTVSIENFGTFSLSLQFKDEKSGDETQRAESIKVKSVLLRPCIDIKRRLTNAGFKRKAENK